MSRFTNTGDALRYRAEMRKRVLEVYSAASDKEKQKAHYVTVVGRAISFTFGFFGGYSHEWAFLWISLATYFVLALAMPPLLRIYKIGV